MGLSDVVPGVSGGTIAFVLGIYPAFMKALSSINFKWLRYLLLYVISGFNKQYLEESKRHFLAIHWRFLLVLLSGMGIAIVIGASFIPALMERYPSQMRAFFLGLVLASIAVPLSFMRRHTRGTVLLTLVTAAWVFLLLGFQGSPPAKWSQVTTTKPQLLRDVSRAHPNMSLPSSIYCPNDTPYDNHALRSAVEATNSEQGTMLWHLCATLDSLTEDPESLAVMWREAGMSQSGTNPYGRATVPADTTIWVPTPSLWYVFISGAVAITAMVLPGVSGSFILLILGIYTFIFTTIRGAMLWVLMQQDNALPLLYLGVFSLGILLGVMVFSRVVTFMFRRYNDATLAILVGVMAGSLRVLWPFQIGSWGHGIVKNVMPTPDDPLITSALLTVTGFLLVIGLAHASAIIEAKTKTVDADAVEG